MRWVLRLLRDIMLKRYKDLNPKKCQCIHANPDLESIPIVILHLLRHKKCLCDFELLKRGGGIELEVYKIL